MSAKVFPAMTEAVARGKVTVPPPTSWSAAPDLKAYQSAKSIVLAMFVVAMVIGAFQSAANIVSAVYELDSVKLDSEATGGINGQTLDGLAIKRANLAAAALATAAFVVSGIGSVVLFEKFGAIL
jgi:hypothetical protein